MQMALWLWGSYPYRGRNTMVRQVSIQAPDSSVGRAFDLKIRWFAIKF